VKILFKQPGPPLPERVQTYELIVEHQAARNLRAVATAFYNHLEDVIRYVSEGPEGTRGYRNAGNYDAPGAELAVEYLWDNGVRLRSSYTYSHVRDAATGQPIVDSPANLFKFNASAPLWEERFRVGFETLYTGERLTLTGDDARAFPLVNLTLRTDKLFPGRLKALEISGTVFNLFDVAYGTVGSAEHTMQVIPQDGINFRLQFTLRL
jgi:iron complex outermembrane receptor protein